MQKHITRGRLKYIQAETDFNTNTIWQPIPLHLNDLIYNNLSLMTHRRNQWLAAYDRNWKI